MHAGQQTDPVIRSSLPVLCTVVGFGTTLIGIAVMLVILFRERRKVLQHNIQRMCQVWARTYEWLIPLYLLGNEARSPREAIGALTLEPGRMVMDISPWLT